MVWDQCRNGKTASEAERGSRRGGGEGDCGASESSQPLKILF